MRRIDHDWRPADRSQPPAAFDPGRDPRHGPQYRARPAGGVDAAIHRRLAELRGDDPPHPAPPELCRGAGARLPPGADCRNRAALSWSTPRRAAFWVSLLIGLLTGLLTGLWAAQPARATGIADAWEGTRWGESSNALLARFGVRATPLRQPIDF